MGMVLGFAPARDSTIRRILEDPPLIWQFVSSEDPEMYEEARRRSSSRARGFFGRLFGRAADPVAAGEVPRLDLVEGEAEDRDLDKSWHGIHYLLTGSDGPGKYPLDFLVAGGREVGTEDVGYGPARVFFAGEVAAIESALSELSDDELRTRFDPPRMMAKKIYPEIWDRAPAEDDTLGYLMDNVLVLRDILRHARSRGFGLVLTIT